MNASLPTTGTSALLNQLSDFVPDDCINQLLPLHRGQGRRPLWASRRRGMAVDNFWEQVLNRPVLSSDALGNGSSYLPAPLV